MRRDILNDMSTSKKIIGSILGIAGVVFFAMLFLNSIDVGELLFETGKLDQHMKENNEHNDEVLLKGKSITIYKNEVDQITRQYQLFHVRNPRETALNYLLSREVIYKEATKNGFVTTASEVQSYIYEQRKELEDNSKKEDIKAYYKGMDLTPEEYWKKKHFEVAKMITNNKYIESLKSDFINKFSNIKGGRTLERLWEKELAKITKQLIQQEQVVEITCSNV